MSDATKPDPRSSGGTPADRAITSAQVAGYSYSGTVAIATAHWLVKCLGTGHWVWHQPDDALIEMWVLYLLPTAHLIAKIIHNKLAKAAGESQ